MLLIGFRSVHCLVPYAVDVGSAARWRGISRFTPLRSGNNSPRDHLGHRVVVLVMLKRTFVRIAPVCVATGVGVLEYWSVLNGYSCGPFTKVPEAHFNPNRYRLSLHPFSPSLSY